MGSDEESKSMLRAQQPVPSSEMDVDDEATPALESGLHHHRPKKAIWIIYFHANLCAILRCMFCLPLVGLAGFMVSPGARPTVLPFAAYTLPCAIIHVFLAAHRVVKPRSADSALPPWWYMAALVVSPVLLLGVFVYGLVVVGLTKQYYDERDMDKVTTCGKRNRKKVCHPKTHDAEVFDCTAAAVALSGVALLCSLWQCYLIYKLHRNRYSSTEIAHATDVVGPATFTSILKQELGDWARWVMFWKKQ